MIGRKKGIDIYYLDLLWGLNVLIHIVLFKGTARLTKRKLSTKRLWVVSVIGSCSIFIVLTPWEFMLVHPFGKVLLSILLVLIGFGFVSLSVFLQQLFMFYVMSFLAAGTIIGLETMRFSLAERQGFLTEYTSVMYNVFSFPLLILAVPVIWWVIKGMTSLMKSRRKRLSKIIKVTVVLEEAKWEAMALVDTGNQLKDPITRTPVMVMEMTLLKPQLSNKEFEQWRHMISTQRVEDLEHMKRWKDRWRLVPFRTAGQEMQMMFTVKPDYILIEEDNQTQTVETMLIGLDTNTLSSTGDFQIIFPADVLPASKHDSA
ncbi:sigma-E processing peptidase SpoIIGA [Salibacterium salarium]|uniref:Sigma-E processing peptidase SpoIIGA n=1 Tax=Salibacterium salarium TaxID=284579 RepID=A0A3R9WQA2_9BACI|nr:sigma-E processing peptidase SpoIIGA [Salibacterium salarium]RSL31305.1 sigma-E processing peptidase SpoIIGA [Salibacterium salarium]